MSTHTPDSWIERQDEDPENAPTGYYQDGEFIETYVAPACGHEMFDESEIDEKGFCVNCSDLSGENGDTKERGMTRHRSKVDAVIPSTNSGNTAARQLVSPAQNFSARPEPVGLVAALAYINRRFNAAIDKAAAEGRPQ